MCTPTPWVLPADAMRQGTYPSHIRRYHRQTAANGGYVPASDSPLFVNAVEKAMRVLMAFDGRQRHLSLSQIAALTRLDLSAAQRFTFTLAELGYLTKDPRTRKYELSPRLLEFIVDRGVD